MYTINLPITIRTLIVHTNAPAIAVQLQFNGTDNKRHRTHTLFKYGRTTVKMTSGIRSTTTLIRIDTLEPPQLDTPDIGLLIANIEVVDVTPEEEVYIIHIKDPFYPEYSHNINHHTTTLDEIFQEQ
jgi:hypothetical protein